MNVFIIAFDTKNSQKFLQRPQAVGLLPTYNKMSRFTKTIINSASSTSCAIDIRKARPQDLLPALPKVEANTMQ